MKGIDAYKILPDTLDPLFREAQTGEDDAVDAFFYEALELVSLSQGLNVAPIIDQAMWFRDNPLVSARAVGYSLLTLGFVDSFRSKHQSSIEFCNEASKLFAEIGYADGVARCSAIIGTSYRGFGNIELAIKYMCQAYTQLHKTDSDFHFTMASAYQMAELYAETGNYTASLTLCNEVWPLMLSPANKRKMFDARLLNTMGNVYAKMGNNTLAIQYLKNALRLSEELHQQPVMARVLTDMGSYYMAVKDYPHAISNNEKALAIREKMHLRGPMLTNIIHIAEAQALHHKPDDAIHMLLMGYTIAEELNVKARMLQILKPLSALYEQKGDLATCLIYYKQYHTILEELNKELQEQKIASIKLTYEAEQAIKENEIIKIQKAEIEKEKKRSDDLLLNILPQEVAEELKNNDVAEARYFSNVTVLFTDFKDFTAATARLTPQQLVSELHACFKTFDEIMEKYGIEKIKTVGDAYLAACGLPIEDPMHAEKVVAAAIEIKNFIKERKARLGDATFEIRIGVNSGGVIAGIVGVKKFAYDIWGDTVNTAARMEQNCETGKVNISASTHALIKDKFACECRGEIHAKGKGKLSMYYVD